jgi:hypothetical protein
MNRKNLNYFFNQMVKNEFLKILIVIISLCMSQLQSQILEKHKWKDRIILVLTDDIHHTIYKK